MIGGVVENLSTFFGRGIRPFACSCKRCATVKRVRYFLGWSPFAERSLALFGLWTKAFMSTVGRAFTVDVVEEGEVFFTSSGGILISGKDSLLLFFTTKGKEELKVLNLCALCCLCG
jgi:hypothetical protein